MANKYKSSATIIPVDDAVGTVLAHDITEIRPGEFKGAAFKKGHIVRAEDIPHLRRLGKENLFSIHLDPHELHEDDAILRLVTSFAGEGITIDGTPTEGKVSLRAAHPGLLKVNREALMDLCMIPEICCATRHTDTVVKTGDIVASTRVIPLIIDESIVADAEKAVRHSIPLLSVRPMAEPSVGILVTGNEVFSGRIKDQFAPIVRKKLALFSCTVRDVSYAPDDRKTISRTIRDLLDKNCELILVTGGMSVDPDDITRLAIADAGTTDIVYGTPVLPGAMLLSGRIGPVPVLGLPACILFYETTVFDLILPRVLAGERITRADLAALAHGGLCLNCAHCTYPLCPFGKG